MRALCPLLGLLFLLVSAPTASTAAGLCDATKVGQPTYDDDLHRFYVLLFRDKFELGDLTDPAKDKGGNVVSVFLKKDGEIRSLIFAGSKAGGPVEYSIAPGVPQTNLNDEQIVALFNSLDAINEIEAPNATFHSEGNAYRIIKSHMAETVDFSNQYDEISVYSERIPCASCENVLNAMREDIVNESGGAGPSFRLSFDFNSQSQFKDLHTWNWDTAFQAWIGN